MISLSQHFMRWLVFLAVSSGVVQSTSTTEYDLPDFTECNRVMLRQYFNYRDTPPLPMTFAAAAEAYRHVIIDLNRVPLNNNTFQATNMYNTTFLYRFLLYTDYSYCTDEQIDAVANGTIEHDGVWQPLLTTGFVRISSHETSTHSRAYVARHDQQKSIIIALSGSRNLYTLVLAANSELTNLDESLYPNLPNTCSTRPSDAQIFEGIQETLSSSFLESIRNSVKGQVQYFPSFTVIITGHSLGGAHALLLGYYLKTQNISIHAIYTWGAPILGTTSLSNWLIECTNATDTTVRVVSDGDIVPYGRYADNTKQPSNVNEVYVLYGNLTIPALWRICRGSDDPQCSIGQPCRSKNFTWHSTYGGLYMAGRNCLLGGVMN